MRVLLTSLLSCAVLMACDKQPEKSATTSPSLTFTGEAISQVESDFAGHWLTNSTIALPQSTNARLTLVELPTKSQLAGKHQLSGYALEPIEFPAVLQAKYPHLADFQLYRVNVESTKIKDMIKGRVAVIESEQDKLGFIHHVQTSYVIDELYTSGDFDADEITDFGALANATSSQFKLWSPTARNIQVKLFDQNKALVDTKAMNFDGETGVWQLVVDQNLDGYYYQYQIETYHPLTQNIEQFTTTDPYSLSLSTNSEHSQIVDLSSRSTMPEGWQTQRDPVLKNKEDAIFYELHIRDFSAAEKRLTNEANRGKYGAFNETDSYGIKHLRTLKNAGLTYIHLLPTFDIGTINEEPGVAFALSDKVAKVCQARPEVSICSQELAPELTLKQALSSYDPLSNEAQHLVSELREFDNYNWGYDPFHYTVPEGSYAVNPEGKARIVEFRQMIQNIHNMGFRVIMDVVYNHTHQAGLAPTAVLDKIVPNYYHRLNPISGAIEQSTCCDNTATERVMMEKLMIDSLVVWAKDYKIDGFRFDLMGHQPKSSMLKARDAVLSVDSDNYFYGEGWNFGEVANNKQFVQASQLELAGTEIGTFSDRLRDAVRGPGISVSGNDIRRNQGIGNGLGTINNELQSEPGAPDYQLLLDQTRIGLAGNLANYPLTLKTGEQVLGKEVPYGDQPTGYALDPADTVNYVSKHDNQTLWDNNQYRTDFSVSRDERVRMHIQSLSYVMLGQGIPFIHMGSELLRSKSYLRDSYDYSDWFNYVDFSKQSNNYHVGLPPAEKDQQNWPLISKIIRTNNGKDQVTPNDIELASQMFNDLLKIRTSSDLFRLTTEQAIIDQLSFLNSGPTQQDGLIAMHLVKADNNDSAFNEIIVLFNANRTALTFAYQGAEQFSLHPVLTKSVDSTAQQSKVKGGTFVVPALTTTVFVK
ncbi:pullulanase-type alpha-1,6-glucosidase [Thalassotalea sp. LPB0316]|uniref:pullulanase-type alpha-1,6-glucosidase n=1 Tax=Thalassotalea sp. LPB0316 TaxID=2769490 RepID=UPI0018694CEB|nr:pullulanase-type alpha-1,6-glucosidase [Thalassotalea sp. LPB0316]QOL26770.1 pullulanase-type alpha-1,6-glucosidase [Thalassotalea sp. LPB0316]